MTPLDWLCAAYLLIGLAFAVMCWRDTSDGSLSFIVGVLWLPLLIGFTADRLKNRRVP